MGFKKSSGIITVSGSVTETGANTFTQEQISLPLDPLNNEVFVILAIDLDTSVPSNVAGTTTSVTGSLSVTSQTDTIGILNPKCLAEAQDSIAQGAGTVDGAAFSRRAGATPTATLDYIAILATDDFYAQVKGSNCTSAKGMNFRVWGYRAKMDSAGYAAMVQSELLS